MKFSVHGAGAIGPGFATLREFETLLRNDAMEMNAPTPSPKPALIPPRERRRSPLAVRLAVEASSEACAAADAAPRDLRAVFASAMGDTSITDYMCRAVATHPIALSPTRFHNSVHNAAVGYWSISTGCMLAANSIAAGPWTFATALYEALAQSAEAGEPVLLTMFDIAAPMPLDFCRVGPSFAVSLVLEAHDRGNWRIQAESAVDSGRAEDGLAGMPVDHAFRLLAAVSGVGASSLDLALSPASRLLVERRP